MINHLFDYRFCCDKMRSPTLEMVPQPSDLECALGRAKVGVRNSSTAVTWLLGFEFKGSVPTRVGLHSEA
jgi:hypothetical protein